MKRFYPRLRHYGVWSAAFLISLASENSIAFEADVHYGLTKWLALQAGYRDFEANAVAVGNYRVDSGAMGHLDLVLDYACLAPDREAVQRIKDKHFPSHGESTVEGGGDAATAALRMVLQESKGKEGQMLGLLGQALHPLQDSFAHAGGSLESRLAGFTICSSSVPQEQSPDVLAAEDPHGRRVTPSHSESIMSAALATYDALRRFPAIGGRERVARSESELLPEISDFSSARTKGAKQLWFRARGISETEFLKGISIPDGNWSTERGDSQRNLPSLSAIKSRQWEIPDDLRQFFDHVIERWLTAEDVDKVAADAFKGANGPRNLERSDVARVRELSARLKLWLVQDHALVAQLAHAPAPFSRSQHSQIDRLLHRKGVPILRSERPWESLTPLVAKGTSPSPLLGYIVRRTAVAGGIEAVALLRLKHAPYDTVGLVAEHGAGGWRLIKLVSVVDQ
ncbi:hypothetical protein [Pseudorhodoferax soli]|uniref:Uncharacterized protein n=1 Tax=Pseudorhodoferax soli TaxID=545864 RepID=A0A368XL14_9BURK|nr:hypothetical protein [Pseudorhodoferax soli]RCW68545.1 hypothetical protein DES41_10766 [Pseudorhodoferax soli]